jgi:hypothetical protein
LVIRGNTDSTKRLNIGYDTTTNKASLQSYTAASTAGPLLLNPSGGNVGIGSATAPSVALDVTGAIKASGDLTAANISAAQLSSSGRVLTDAIDFFTDVSEPSAGVSQVGPRHRREILDYHSYPDRLTQLILES